MHVFSKISVLVAVIGTVGILHAMIDMLSTPAPISAVKFKDVVRQHIRQEDLNLNVDNNEIVTNIYKTDSGSFYFLTSPKDSSTVDADKLVFEKAPLVNSHFSVDITGPIARTTVKQTFENNSSFWQDGVFVFPLTTDAAVDALVMRVGDREIIGEVQPKEQAKKLFEQAKSAGKNASLVSQIRPNIFKNELSNIPPNTHIEIEIQYQQLLKYSDTGYELKIPTGIAPRYQGAVTEPDENDVAPILSPGKIEVQLNMGMPLQQIKSLHHLIEQRQNNSVEYYINTTADTIDNRMFVLRWEFEEVNHTQLAHLQQRDGNQTYGLISMLAPKKVDVQLKRDITFILDTSGSMVGEALEQAKAAIAMAISDLATVDRFNIIEFDSDANALWGTSDFASDGNILAAQNFLSDLQADGGTEMLGALEMAFDLLAYRKNESERVQQIVFVTDGSVANEASILKAIKRRIGDARLFTIGIGSAPNDYFMQEAAIVGKGFSSFIGDLKQVKPEMTRFLDKIRHPALTNLHLSLPSAAQHSVTPVIQTFPEKLPDLYAGEPFFVFYKTNNDQDVWQNGVEFAAQQASVGSYGNVINQKVTRTLNPSNTKQSKGISKQWAYAKVQHIMRNLHTTQVTGNDYKTLASNAKTEITQLSLEHQIVSAYTSLLAIDHDQINAVRARQLSQLSTGNSHISTQKRLALQALPATATPMKELKLWGLLCVLFAGIAGALLTSRAYSVITLAFILNLIKKAFKRYA